MVRGAGDCGLGNGSVLGHRRPMDPGQIITVISAHAEGEVGDVIISGVDPPPGATLWDQSRWIARDDRLRRFMLNEPRGGVFRHVNLLVPPTDPAAQIAWIIMEPADTPPMSGSNAICVATVVLETGIVAMAEPETRLIMQAPGGLIEVVATCSGGKVTGVRLTNQPSFVDRLDAALEVAGLGTLTVDTAYGGDSFVIVDAPALGFTLHASEARDLAETGARITAAANAAFGFAHPEISDWNYISFCQFAGPIAVTGGLKTARIAVAIRPGKIDRSPCGTGLCARMAVLHARGALGIGENFAGLSIIGSRFDGRIEALATVAGRAAIIPSLAGRAWITGRHEHWLDPTDPWPLGYRLSDTWPGAK